GRRRDLELAPWSRDHRGAGCTCRARPIPGDRKTRHLRDTRLGLQPFRNNLSLFAIDLDRVIRQRPAFLGSLLREVVDRVEQGTLQPLPRQAWTIGEWSEAFRFMQQGKHIGKIVLAAGDEAIPVVPSEDEPVTFRADGSYLITGGLGGFAVTVARWMA